MKVSAFTNGAPAQLSDILGAVRGSSNVRLTVADLARGVNLKTFTATAANTFAAGEIGYITAAGTITKADADAQASTAAFLVMANESVAGGASGTFIMPGGIWTTTGLTPGTLYYVSQTAGAITTTPPSASGTYTRQIGVALSATELLFNPSEIVVPN